jgi:hypothetical protein
VGPNLNGVIAESAVDLLFLYFLISVLQKFTTRFSGLSLFLTLHDTQFLTPHPMQALVSAIGI